MFPMNYTIPALELGWGIFTLLQYRVQSFGELMAYRFMVGIFEVSDHLWLSCTSLDFELTLTQAAFFPGVHYVLGSW
jgi:hypothetical protein